MKFKYPYKGPYPSHSQRLRFYGYTQLAEACAFVIPATVPYAWVIFLLTGATLSVANSLPRSGPGDVPALAAIGVLHVACLFLFNKMHSKFLGSRQAISLVEYFHSQDPGPASMDDEEKL